jgi:hypothetical protein
VGSLWSGVTATAFGADRQVVPPSTPQAVNSAGIVEAGSSATEPVPAEPAAPPATSGQSNPQQTEVTCRMVKVTGSRVRKEKVCSTRGTTRNAQEWLRNQQDRGANEGVDPGG